MATKNRFSVEATFTAVDNMSAKFVKMGKRVDSFADGAAKALKKVDGTMSAIDGGLRKVGAAAVAMGVGVGYAAREAITGGMDFEQAIANVGAVSLMTRGEVRDLEVAALRLGKSTKFSATEVAAGMELMGKAGFTNSQILEGIPSLLAAAAAEGAEFEETAGTISNTLKGMGLEVTDAARVADVLTLASARTNSSISSLGESMKNVSPVARQFKIPLEDAVTAVALLQDVGLDASEAGTATATMLTKLAKPTDDMAKKMASLGVNFRKANGDMKALPEVLGEFQKAADKSKGNMKVVAFFADLVGLRGQKAALNLQELFKQGKFADLAKELQYAAGSAEKMAALRMDTFGGDVKLLENDILDLKIALFDTQSGPMRDLVNQTRAWIGDNKELMVSGVADFIGKIRDNFEGIVKWGTRIGELVAGFYALNTAVKVARLSIEAYQIGSGLIMGVGKAALWSATQLGLFNAVAAAGEKPLTALRMGLNWSKVGMQVNSVTSLMGKAGLLGAALAVGVAIGTWANQTFALDEKISGLVAKFTGIEDTLDELGGRAEKPGLTAGGEQRLADGTVLNGRTGEIITKGSDWEGVLKRRQDRIRAQVAGTNRFDGMSLTPEAATASKRTAFEWDAKGQQQAPTFSSQMVTPAERITRSVYESTEKNEMVIQVQPAPGTEAKVTKRPPARSKARVRLQPTGGF